MLTGSDKIAVIVYGVAAELNLHVGRDLAVVGFDGSVGAALLHPQLTSVVMPIEDIARRVVGPGAAADRARPRHRAGRDRRDLAARGRKHACSPVTPGVAKPQLGPQV